MDPRLTPDARAVPNCSYALLAGRFDPGCGEALGVVAGNTPSGPRNAAAKKGQERAKRSGLFPRLLRLWRTERVARRGGQSSSYSWSYSVVSTADDEYEYDHEHDSGFRQTGYRESSCPCSSRRPRRLVHARRGRRAELSSAQKPVFSKKTGFSRSNMRIADSRIRQIRRTANRSWRDNSLMAGGEP